MSSGDVYTCSRFRVLFGRLVYETRVVLCYRRITCVMNRITCVLHHVSIVLRHIAGVLYHRWGRLAQADASYTRALELNPDDAQTRSYRTTVRNKLQTAASGG